MNYSRRAELLEKIAELLLEGKGVAVCGAGFDFDVFAQFLYHEMLAIRLPVCSNLRIDAGVQMDFITGGRLAIFNVTKKDQLAFFLDQYKDATVYPLDLLMLLEPPETSFKDLYNNCLMPVLLDRDSARVQVVRA